MTRQELRVFLQKWFCGCGLPEEACRTLYDLLSFAPFHSHYDELTRKISDDGFLYLTLYTLDHFGLIEHGGNVVGAWLSDKGREVLAALAIEEEDGFEELCGPSCVHGRLTMEHCAECTVV